MKLTIITFLLFSAIHTLAQDSSFQLKDYKYRTPGYKSLYLSVNFSGGISDSKKSEDYSDKNFSLAPSLVTYLKTISTDARLFETVLSFLPYGGVSSTSTNNKETSAKNLQSYLSYRIDNRFYKKQQFFFEIGNDLTNELHADKRTDTIQSYKSNLLQVQNIFTLGIGKGRIEQVQDAQMALYILNDLEKQGLLSSKVTHEKALAFAKLITEINNKRIFDSRKKRIYELTQIDSFLRSSGLATTTDIRHFTTINDNWALAFNPYRLSGSNWYVRIKPGIGYTLDKSDNASFGANYSSNYNNFFLSLSPVVGYEKYVAVNLKWQLNMGTSFAFEGIKNTSRTSFLSNGLLSNAKSNSYENFWLFNAFYGFGYFPNTRTQIGADFNLDASMKTKDYIIISPSLRFYANYFISYRTYLRADFNLLYDHTNDQSNILRNIEGHNVNTGLSLSFSHILF